MTEYKIVPSVATDEMVDSIRESYAAWQPSEKLYQAALSAAPDTSHLVIVEKSILKQVLQAMRDLRAKPIDWEYSQGEQLLIGQIKDILNDK